MKFYTKPTTPALVRATLENGKATTRRFTFCDATLFEAGTELKKLFGDHLIPKEQSSLRITIRIREYVDESHGSSSSFTIFDITMKEAEALINTRFAELENNS